MGFLVLCGCALGVILFIRRCALHGLDGMLFSRVGMWILIWSFACARASHVFLYRWEAYRDQPLDMFKIWERGFSSYGCFFGAAIVAIYYALQHWINFWPLADAEIYAFMCGWTIGLSVEQGVFWFMILGSMTDCSVWICPPSWNRSVLAFCLHEK
ncbi:prolipoprotein diacylglyceryl transferase [Verrucomicrobia bacterium]|nr:prolipoprotein diacylglyceryl transferase [Verrucomicrobiota bacterium]